MRTLLAALTALMLFATPVVAGDFEDALAAANAGDFQKAFRLWKPLAERGDKRAQFYLGSMCDKGRGVPEDDAKAVHWYRMAAEQGVVDAQNRLGEMYEGGQGVSKSAKKAVHWFRKGAEGGLPIAQYNLADMYRFGYAVIERSLNLGDCTGLVGNRCQFGWHGEQALAHSRYCVGPRGLCLF